MDDKNAERRDFLSLTARGMWAISGLLLAVPGLGALLDPVLRPHASRKEQERLLGTVDSFELGKPRKISIAATQHDGWQMRQNVVVGSVWVIRTQSKPAEFTVFSAICPHLGCPVSHASAGFLCPCHNSQFDLQGTRTSGPEGAKNPSPRNMDKLDYSVRDGQLYCQYQKFKPGVAEQTAV